MDLLVQKRTAHDRSETATSEDWSYYSCKKDCKKKTALSDGGRNRRGVQEFMRKERLMNNMSFGVHQDLFFQKSDWL